MKKEFQMKLRNSILKYFGLFAVVFSLSAGIVLSTAGTAGACLWGECHEFFEECPEGSTCPGVPCVAYSHIVYSATHCCNVPSAVETWFCWD
jgi:hypothetical protein